MRIRTTSAILMIPTYSSSSYSSVSIIFYYLHIILLLLTTCVWFHNLFLILTDSFTIFVRVTVLEMKYQFSQKIFYSNISSSHCCWKNLLLLVTVFHRGWIVALATYMFILHSICGHNSPVFFCRRHWNKKIQYQNIS